MNIGIDGTPLAIPFPCGSRTYAEELLNAIASVDSINHYYVFSSKGIKIPSKSNFKYINIPKQIPILKRQLFLPIQVKRNKIDVFHYLEPFGSVFLQNIPIITTVHDLDLNQILPKARNFKELSNKFYMKLIRVFVFKNTKQIITVSNFTKKQLKSETLTSKIPSTTIYEAPKKIFTNKKHIERNNYIMALADYSPRKNILRLINAYKQLPDKLKNKYKLCLVVSTKEVSDNIKTILEKEGLSNRSKIIIAPSDNTLCKLYQSATVFIYPSLYEGFGLPILEAMACGCPVITSYSGATREVASNSALLINPKSVTSIRSSLEKILTDKLLQKKLSIAGLKNLNNFSWEKTAIKTINVYTKLYRRSLHK